MGKQNLHHSPSLKSQIIIYNIPKMKEGGDVRKSTSERKMYPGVWMMDCVKGQGRSAKVISIQDNHNWWFPSTMLWPYKKFVFQKISIFLNGNYYYFYYYSSSFIYFYYYDDDVWPWISMVENAKLERKAPLSTCASLLFHLLLESDRNRKTRERERIRLHRWHRLTLVDPHDGRDVILEGFSYMDYALSHSSFLKCSSFPRHLALNTEKRDA